MRCGAKTEERHVLGKTTASDCHQKYTYLFTFHAKGASVRVRVRVVVRFGSLSHILLAV